MAGGCVHSHPCCPEGSCPVPWVEGRRGCSHPRLPYLGEIRVVLSAGKDRVEGGSVELSCRDVIGESSNWGQGSRTQVRPERGNWRAHNVARKSLGPVLRLFSEDICHCLELPLGFPFLFFYLSCVPHWRVAIGKVKCGRGRREALRRAIK